ncbi:hypothetical protein HK096_005497, partial [Nowakowskiella sp. JEL0078]
MSVPSLFDSSPLRRTGDAWSFAPLENTLGDHVPSSLTFSDSFSSSVIETSPRRVQNSSTPIRSNKNNRSSALFETFSPISSSRTTCFLDLTDSLISPTDLESQIEQENFTFYGNTQQHQRPTQVQQQTNTQLQDLLPHAPMNIIYSNHLPPGISLNLAPGDQSRIWLGIAASSAAALFSNENFHLLNPILANPFVTSDSQHQFISAQTSALWGESSFIPNTQPNPFLSDDNQLVDTTIFTQSDDYETKNSFTEFSSQLSSSTFLEELGPENNVAPTIKSFVYPSSNDPRITPRSHSDQSTNNSPSRRKERNQQYLHKGSFYKPPNQKEGDLPKYLSKNEENPDLILDMEQLTAPPSPGNIQNSATKLVTMSPVLKPNNLTSVNSWMTTPSAPPRKSKNSRYSDGILDFDPSRSPTPSPQSLGCFSLQDTPISSTGDMKSFTSRLKSSDTPSRLVPSTSREDVLDEDFELTLTPSPSSSENFLGQPRIRKKVSASILKVKSRNVDMKTPAKLVKKSIQKRLSGVVESTLPSSPSSPANMWSPPSSWSTTSSPAPSDMSEDSTCSSVRKGRKATKTEPLKAQIDEMLADPANADLVLQENKETGTGELQVFVRDLNAKDWKCTWCLCTKKETPALRKGPLGQK